MSDISLTLAFGAQLLLRLRRKGCEVSSRNVGQTVIYKLVRMSKSTFGEQFSDGDVGNECKDEGERREHEVPHLEEHFEFEVLGAIGDEAEEEEGEEEGEEGEGGDAEDVLEVLYLEMRIGDGAYLGGEEGGGVLAE